MREQAILKLKEFSITPLGNENLKDFNNLKSENPNDVTGESPYDLYTNRHVSHM